MLIAIAANVTAVPSNSQPATAPSDKYRPPNAGAGWRGLGHRQDSDNGVGRGAQHPPDQVGGHRRVLHERAGAQCVRGQALFGAELVTIRPLPSGCSSISAWQARRSPQWPHPVHRARKSSRAALTTSGWVQATLCGPPSTVTNVRSFQPG